PAVLKPRICGWNRRACWPGMHCLRHTNPASRIAGCPFQKDAVRWLRWRMTGATHTQVRPITTNNLDQLPPRTSLMRTPLIALVLLLALSALALAQQDDTSALINAQLDKLYEDELNHTLPETIKRIADKTGVKIEADPLVWDLLPWGYETNVTATIKNTTLRQALDAITQKLGLTY